MTTAPPTTGEPLRLRAASFGYGGPPVLRRVDLRVGAGEFVAVLGPNGAGKSTLVKGVLRLAALEEGSLDLFGTPAGRFRDWARIGYVPQRHTLAGGLPATVAEVVTSGRLARTRRFHRLGAHDRAAVAYAVDAVGLTGKERHPVATLSGGQQRRTLIARALAAEPEVLVLDEPTAGVDAANRDVLAATLGALASAGTTVLLVAHDLGPLEPLVDRVVWVRDGAVVFDGSPHVARQEFVIDADPHPLIGPGAGAVRRPGHGLGLGG